jgi:uncharacterized protein YdcH (DUF465 family)
MNSEMLQQLKDELKQEMSERLKDAKFDKLLEKYGILGDNILQFECILDLSQIYSHASIENKESPEKLTVIQGEEVVRISCDWCACCGCC